MTVSESRSPLQRIPTWVVDLILSGFVAAPAFIPLFDGSIETTPVGTLAVLLPAAALLLRRRYPFVVLGVCVVSFGVAVFNAPLHPSMTLASAIAVYTVAVQTDRRTTVITALAVIAPVVLLTALASDTGAFEALPIQGAVSIGFAAALGNGVRVNRAYIAEITARAIHAEATRESEASRRVAEERLRIARDLHDVVAHQITVISLNAGVATSALDNRPDAAREALATIRSAARRVLGEIGGLLTVLRTDDEQPGRQPGLAELDNLVRDFTASGLAVGIRRDGDRTSLPPVVDVVAYRVLQEALTNALKHGTDSRAHVLIERERRHLRIVVTNPTAGISTTQPPTSGGHGLQGIQERVASIHGHISIENRGDTFRLEVILPVDETAEDSL